MDKKIVLISAYCDNFNKLLILEQNIKKLKQLNVDIAIISPLYIPQYIIDKIDYFFLIKENYIFIYPAHFISYWSIININNKQIKLMCNKSDYGFNTLNHLKKLLEIFSTYNYDMFYFIIYDVLLTDDLLNIIKTYDDTLFFKFKRNDEIFFNVGLQFICINKNDVNKFINGINIDVYLGFNGFAETYVNQYLIEKFNFKVHDSGVADLINISKNVFNFIFNDFNDFSFFIIYEDVLKIFFYNVLNEDEILININDNILNVKIYNELVYDSNLNKESIQKLKFLYNNKELDLSDKIKDLINNQIEYL